jgi:hypothetical protein
LRKNAGPNSCEDEPSVSHDDQGHAGRAQQTVPGKPGNLSVNIEKVGISLRAKARSDC